MPKEQTSKKTKGQASKKDAFYSPEESRRLKEYYKNKIREILERGK